MITEKFNETLKHEGVVSLVTWTAAEANVTNTWNSYLHITEDERILLPAAGLKSTEADLAINNRIKMTLGSRDVEGRDGYQGIGFKIEGTAKFITEGEEFDMMFEKFPFIRAVLEVEIEKLTQLL